MTKSVVLSAFGLWVVWTFATWLFEGRIETFSRPDAVADRLIYTFVANILIGTIGAITLLRLVLAFEAQGWKTTGFGPRNRTAVWIPLGTTAGVAFFVCQGAPSTNPIVILNAFAQVLVVSVAEVLVCWSVVAGILAIAINRPRWITYTAASIVASFLFGVYHLAHSAPFNTLQMIAFLSMIGMLTSVFFFISHDVYGTIIFHSFLGTFGVLQALSAQGRLVSFETLQAPLIAAASITLVILIALDVRFSRRGFDLTGIF
jgi:hypothetical protein